MRDFVCDSKYDKAIEMFDTFDYESHDELLDFLEEAVEHYKAEKLMASGRRTIDEDDVVKILSASLPIIRVQTGDSRDDLELAMYSFDEPRCWTYEKYIQNETIMAVAGVTSSTFRKSVIEGFKADRKIPLIKLKHNSDVSKATVQGREVFDTFIDFKNGRYHTATGEMEEYKPSLLAFNQLQYEKIDKLDPQYKETFDKFFITLADGHAQRAKVMKQVYYCSMIGFNPGKQAINLYGKAGGGKSTYLHGMTALAGGHRAYTNITYSDLNKDDALASIGSSKLIVGFDNDDRVVVNKLAVLKSLLSKERFSYFRKFDTRGYNVFYGLFVQAFNDMPEFATGSSKQPIIDRMFLLSFNARLRNTSNEIVDYDKFLQNPETLSQLSLYLLEEVDYFEKLESPDEKKLEDIMNEGDMITQFINELRISGAFVNQILPSTHLYGHFVDWFRGFNAGGRLMSQRLFSMRINEALVREGYTFVSNRARPSGFDYNKYQTSILVGGQSISEDSELHKVIKNNYNSSYYIKTVPDYLEEEEAHELVDTIENDHTQSEVSSKVKQIVLQFSKQNDPMSIGLVQSIEQALNNWRIPELKNHLHSMIELMKEARGPDD